MCKISIIVPVYGVEKYIERCVISLLEQTITDIEYIFIDDCTPDRSMEILQSVIEKYRLRLAAENKTVRIERMPTNSGLAAVRRHGVQLAKGNYIIHCDSDDWVDTNMYELMYSRTENNKVDVVICDYYIEKGNHRESRKGFSLSYLNTKMIVENMFAQNIPYCVWNKMVKRDTLLGRDIIFPYKTHGEDLAINLQLFSNPMKIAYVPQPLYHYKSDSITMYHVVDEQTIVKKYNDNIENVKIVEKYYKKRGIFEEYEKSLMYVKMTSRDKLLPLLGQDKYYELWKSTFPEINHKVVFNEKIKIKHRVKFLLTKYRLVRFSE